MNPRMTAVFVVRPTMNQAEKRAGNDACKANPVYTISLLIEE
jgi:hypothetical protein